MIPWPEHQRRHSWTLELWRQWEKAADRLTVSFISQHLLSRQPPVTDDCLMIKPGCVCSRAWAAEEDKIKKSEQIRARRLWEKAALRVSLLPKREGVMTTMKILEWNSFNLLALYCDPLITKVRELRGHWWMWSHVACARCLFWERKAWRGEERAVLMEETHGKCPAGVQGETNFSFSQQPADSFNNHINKRNAVFKSKGQKNEESLKKTNAAKRQNGRVNGKIRISVKK